MASPRVSKAVPLVSPNRLNTLWCTWASSVEVWHCQACCAILSMDVLLLLPTCALACQLKPWSYNHALPQGTPLLLCQGQNSGLQPSHFCAPFRQLFRFCPAVSIILQGRCCDITLNTHGLARPGLAAEPDGSGCPQPLRRCSEHSCRSESVRIGRAEFSTEVLYQAHAFNFWCEVTVS